MKKLGAPGSDKITVALILGVGDPFIDLIFEFCKAMWTTEYTPEQFLRDTIVPFFNRDSIWRSSNYRPVSVLQVCAKVFQALIYNRAEATLNLSGTKNGFAGRYQYGGCRKRDRFILLRIMEAITANESIMKENVAPFFS